MKPDAKPFLKWAGGKGQLLPVLKGYLPSDAGYTTYIEPFIGGGALFFEVANTNLFEHYVINDFNIELATAYRVVKSNVLDLVDQLKKIEIKYHFLDQSAQKEFFYKIRNEFNNQKDVIDYKVFDSFLIQHIAYLIFLNRTCFNGLYRQNSKGGFNVPFGDYKNPKICDEANLIACSNMLQKATILSGDFENVSPFVNDMAFIYLDPPYRPLSTTSSFNSYAREAFNDDSQKRLASWFKLCSDKGARVLLSNSDPKNTDMSDNFFDDLYSNYNILRIEAKRMINSKKENRGSITELLIMNF